MSPHRRTSASLVSLKAYALILSSAKMRRALAPQGLHRTPYEVLDYDLRVTLEDSKGMHATFDKTQRVRFVQNGVSAILDHTWGDGVYLASYDNGAGRLQDSIKDGSKRHLVIGLKRSMARGEVFRFDVSRTVIAGFTNENEWMETIVDHPVGRVRRKIVFPKGRPCQMATLIAGTHTQPLRIRRLKDGRTAVGFTIAQAEPDMPYMVRWSW